MINRIYKIIKWRFKSFKNYYLPNISNFSNKERNIGKGNRFNQTTLIRGIGKIEIGCENMFGYEPGGFHRGGSIEIQARTSTSYIKIGSNVHTNNNIFICSCGQIIIEDDVLIGQGVTIMDFEAHGISPLKRHQIGQIGKVRIGKNVWIGNNVIILKNTQIGHNSIVAAGAIVRGSFPDNVIIGGVPAKIIKKID